MSGGSSTGFNYAPGVGVELPVGGGKTVIDVAIRWDGISRSGSSANSLALRAGVNIPVGN